MNREEGGVDGIMMDLRRRGVGIREDSINTLVCVNDVSESTGEITPTTTTDTGKFQTSISSSCHVFYRRLETFSIEVSTTSHQGTSQLKSPIHQIPITRNEITLIGLCLKTFFKFYGRDFDYLNNVVSVKMGDGVKSRLEKAEENSWPCPVINEGYDDITSFGYSS